jgi:hypothetical protein
MLKNLNILYNLIVFLSLVFYYRTLAPGLPSRPSAPSTHSPKISSIFRKVANRQLTHSLHSASLRSAHSVHSLPDCLHSLVSSHVSHKSHHQRNTFFSKPPAHSFYASTVKFSRSTPQLRCSVSLCVLACFRTWAEVVWVIVL